jgi:anti-sigma factor RsiW
MHVGSEELKRYSSGQLSEAEADALQAHLAECKSCRRDLARFLEDPAWYGEERRSETRTAVDIPASIKLLDPVTSTSPPQHARVI